jgi:Protein phosphatase 2C
VGWKAVTRSVIGTSHQQQQMPCQDYGGDRILDQIMIGAVADGAGSAKQSELGAKLAVTTALHYLVATEDWLQQRQQSWQTLATVPSPRQAEKLFSKTVEKVQAALEHHAASHHYPVDELACTLLMFLATPQWIMAMQIGDGFIVICPQHQDYQLLFQPSKGEFANQTTFVTSSTALAEMQVRVIAAPQAFICAATDGLERVAIRLSDWQPFPPFFNPLAEYLDETAIPEQQDEYLMQFLTSDRLNTRTDDDKTLLLCRYQATG